MSKVFKQTQKCDQVVVYDGQEVMVNLHEQTMKDIDGNVVEGFEEMKKLNPTLINRMLSCKLNAKLNQLAVSRGIPSIVQHVNVTINSLVGIQGSRKTSPITADQQRVIIKLQYAAYVMIDSNRKINSNDVEYTLEDEAVKLYNDGYKIDKPMSFRELDKEMLELLEASS